MTLVFLPRCCDLLRDRSQWIEARHGSGTAAGIHTGTRTSSDKHGMGGTGTGTKEHVSATWAGAAQRSNQEALCSTYPTTPHDL